MKKIITEFYACSFGKQYFLLHIENPTTESISSLYILMTSSTNWKYVNLISTVGPLTKEHVTDT